MSVKVNSIKINNKLIPLLAGLLSQMTKAYTAAGASTLQLELLKYSKDSAEPGVNIGGMDVLSLCDGSYDTGGQLVNKVAIGKLSSTINTIGSISRTPTAALSDVQAAYYGAPTSSAHLYRIITTVNTEGANAAITSVLSDTGTLNKKEVFQGSLAASENIGYSNALPTGSSSVPLFNDTISELNKTEQSYIDKIEKGNRVETGSIIGDLTNVEDPANNTELDQKSDLFGVSSVQSIDMKNVPARTILKTYEEMEAVIRSCTREITEVVVHHTDTYEDQWVDFDDLVQWHVVDRGWSDVGYHFLIQRNGDLQVCRPISRTGAHVLKGHNRYSIGISFCGGKIGSASNRSKYAKRSSNTFQPEQWKVFDKFMKAFYTVHPGGQAFGHFDIDPTRRSDPNFDVVAYVKSKWGKTNVQTPAEASRNGPLSISSINTARGNN
jgi:N-acetylmuramoyl-L-alanine amidase